MALIPNERGSKVLLMRKIIHMQFLIFKSKFLKIGVKKKILKTLGLFLQFRKPLLVGLVPDIIFPKLDRSGNHF